MTLEYEPAPPHQRNKAFERDNHQCQWCGKFGPERGGTAALEAHHIIPIPDGGTHELTNLVTVCFEDHRWYHSLDRLKTADVQLETMSYEPSPIDLLIVLALGAKGPAETRTVAKVAGTTTETASQRLYKLTALDIIEPSLSLYNQAEAAEWDFAGCIENSAVGKLPSDSKKAAQLVRDDMIRRQIEAGLSHQQVADELGLTRRTVIKSVDRARALRPPVPNISTSTLALEQEIVDGESYS